MFEKYKILINLWDASICVFGVGYLCPAMSIAVKTMRKGEVAELALKLSCKFIRSHFNLLFLHIVSVALDYIQ